MKIYVVNGPNLNFLGIREKKIYGTESYDDLVEFCKTIALQHGFDVEIFQSNSEGELIDILQSAYYNEIDGVVLNAGAYTHYSYAIRDAIASIQIPTVEVHLSNILEREDFRKISVIKEVCVASYFGKKFESYREALEHLVNMKKEK